MKKAVNYRPLFFIFIFLLFGIVCSRRLFLGEITTIIFVFVAISLLIVWLCVYKKFKILAFLLASFCLGIGLFFIGAGSYKVNHFSSPVAVVGRVSDNLKDEQNYYSILLDEVKINGKADKNISLKISKNDDNKIKVGDILAFETSLESVSLWTLKNFNTYYYRSNIGYNAKIKSSDIVAIEGHIKLDEKVRMAVKEKLEKNLSQENAGLCYALLFGDKIEVKSDILTSYKNSGIIHILAVSGLHVSFLLGLILGLLKLCKVNKYVSFALTTIMLLLFAYLCNFTPSVVRASLMGVFFMLSKLVGRRYDTLSSLGLGGIIILLISPLTAFDIGFLLSIYCVIGITLLGKSLYKVFIKFTPKVVAGSFSVSVASQIITMPLLGYFNGQINFLSPFVNLIIVPFFGLLFPYLVISVVISLILPFMGFLLAPAGWGFSAVTSFVKFFGETSLYAPVIKASDVTTMIFFIMLFAFSSYLLVSTKKRTIFILILTLSMCISGIVTYFIPVNDSLSATYLSVNGNDCFIFTSSSGDRVLVGQNSLIESYQQEFNVRDIDYYISCQTLTDDEISSAQDYGIKNYVACMGDYSCEGAIISQDNICGDFYCSYLTDENKILGVLLVFDGQKVFIATSDKERYNEKYNYYLSLQKPNIIFTGDNDGIGKDMVAVSRRENEIAKFSHEKMGNGRFYFLKNKIVWEALD